MESHGEYPDAIRRLALMKNAALIEIYDRAVAGLRAMFERLAKRMLDIRVDGVWLQVMDCSDRPGNYKESSGSISEAVVSWDLKGTGAYIQAACEMERIFWGRHGRS